MENCITITIPKTIDYLALGFEGVLPVAYRNKNKTCPDHVLSIEKEIEAIKGMAKSEEVYAHPKYVSELTDSIIQTELLTPIMETDKLSVSTAKSLGALNLIKEAFKMKKVNSARLLSAVLTILVGILFLLWKGAVVSVAMTVIGVFTVHAIGCHLIGCCV